MTGQTLALSVKDFAVLLGCSERHIERQDAAGKLPSPFRLGRGPNDGVWRPSVRG